MTTERSGGRARARGTSGGSRRRRWKTRFALLPELEDLEGRWLLAARSVDVTFVNLTPYTLNFVRGNISHGVWSTLPPSRINPYSTVQFGSESNGVATGTEAEEVYQIDFTGLEVDIHWDNPYVGSNSYSESAPIGFRISHVGGSGDNAQVAYLLSMIDDDASGAPDAWEFESYTATFVNNTGSPLVLDHATLDDGRWLPGQSPPTRIEIGATATWASRSNYVPVQTAGEVVYKMQGTPFTFSVTWDVPMSFGIPLPGLNSFGISAPAGFSLTRTGGDGQLDARVDYDARIVDTDGDGIPDDWEVNGINDNGTVFRLANADPLRKDIYIEVDAMAEDLDGNGLLNVTNEAVINRDFNLDGTISAGTSVNENMGPNSGVLQAVAAAFAAAPVSNPNGSTGITLHFDGVGGVDDAALPLIPWGSTTSANAWPNLQATKATWFGTQAERSRADSANLLAAKALVYHYAVFAFCQGASSQPSPTPGGPPISVPNTSSGLADGSNDFMVTLGDWGPSGGTSLQQEGTFMHELGHNLGLGHGGGDGINWKPNYHSVMNYVWQTPQSWMSIDPNGVSQPSIWTLDYSRRTLPALNEGSLDETKGIQGTAGLWTLSGPNTNVRSVWETGAVDWDDDKDNGTETSAPADINFLGDVNGDGAVDGNDATPNQVLNGYNDWANLQYNIRRSRDFLVGQDDPNRNGPQPEMTYETYRALNRDTVSSVRSSLNASTYGQAVTLTASVTSFIGQVIEGGTIEFRDGATSLGTATVQGGTASLVTTLLTAGNHAITVRYAGNGTFQPSTSDVLYQVVNRAPLSVTADDAMRTYGDPNPSFTGSIVGIQNGDAISATYSTPATPSSDVGMYPIVPTLIDPDNRLSNYDVTPQNGTLTITKAHLTVTADDQTKIFRAPNPTLTATITGFVLDQTLSSSGVTGAPALSTTATADSPVGTYPITVTIGTLAAKNYDFPTFRPGTLSITYAIQVLTDLSRAQNPNSTIPIRITLADYYGNNLSSPTISLHARYIVPASDPSARLPVQSPGDAQPDDDFRYTGRAYHFNLKNKGRAAGSYRLVFSVDGDPLLHTVAFVLQ